MRAFCHNHKIVYQGFSLLTANQEVLHHPLIASLTIASLTASANATPAQVVFRFAHSLGILPLTGTTNPEHMKQDLTSRDIELPPEAVQAIEALAG